MIALLVLGMTAVAGRSASGQDATCEAGEQEVSSLAFVGNRSLGRTELSNAIVTTPSSLPRRTIRVLGVRRCLDAEHFELKRDVLRLIVLYRNRGFAGVQVDTVVTAAARGTVAVRFYIVEGSPVIVRSLAVTGLAGIRDSSRIVRNLPLRLGAPFDKYRAEATRDTLLRRLRNAGRPDADVLRSYDTQREARSATVTYEVLPGPPVQVGQIAVAVTPRPGRPPNITPAAVRRVAGLRPGAMFRERDVVEAQRRLYQTDLFRRVDVTLLTDSLGFVNDTTVGVAIAVEESDLYAATLGGGWGTLDCVRVQGGLVDRDFLGSLPVGGARKLELTGRLSKLGVGRPANFAPWICTSDVVNDDPYSQRLNYYAGATVRQPALFGLRYLPSVTVFSERRGEFLAYLRTTNIGALATVNWQPRPRLPMTFSYRIERGRTEAQPGLFCAAFNICDLADQQRRQQTLRLAVFSGSLTRDRSNSPLNPTRGSISRFEVRHASNVIGSDATLEFNKVLGDASWYVQVSDRGVLAARVRAGAVFGSNVTTISSVASFVPPEERLYAGGPTTVRGFRQNELGPVVYIARRFHTEITAIGDTIYVADTDARPDRVVPTGGNTLAVGTVEYRLRGPVLPELLQTTLFVDAGEVWNRGGGSQGTGFRTLRVTPGVGLRVFTAVGAIGMDVGYNNYARRHGASYFLPPVGASGEAALICVSPGNTRPVRTVSTGEGRPVLRQDAGECPGSFRPNRSNSVASRFTFQFSIGQAF